MLRACLAAVVMVLALIAYATVSNPWGKPTESVLVLRTEETATCPHGEIQVSNRWGYKLVGFCEGQTYLGVSIIIRTVDLDGHESTRQFIQGASTPKDEFDLLVWTSRLQEAMEDAGIQLAAPSPDEPAESLRYKIASKAT